MDPALEVIYARVRDRLEEAEFVRRVVAARAEFGGLLDEEALGLLVLDELGLNEGAYATLADLAGRSEATVRVRVERVEPPRSFERPGRDPGRVANVVVSDATGESRLVFWDRDVERVEEGALRPGVHVTVVNGRVKPGRFGVELHVGPWSVLEVEGALDPAKRKLLADVAPESETRSVQTRLPGADGPSAIEGALAWLGPTRPYRTKEGATSFVCELDVETAEGIVRVVAWDGHVRSVRALQLGARVRLEPVAARVKGATTEWHTTRETKLSS